MFVATLDAAGGKTFPCHLKSDVRPNEFVWLMPFQLIASVLQSVRCAPALGRPFRLEESHERD